MKLKFIKDYKDNTKYRLSFNELAGGIFGIDFEEWYRFGFWNDRYICYSFAVGNKIVSNVSANLLDIILDGKRVNSLQIGTVMTHPDYRGKGLGEELMNTVLKEYKSQCKFMFLFGDKKASGFYNKFEFSTVSETAFSMNGYIGSEKVCEYRRLDLSGLRDINILKRLSQERIPISSKFGVDNAGSILAWHCINIFPNDIYYFEASDILVIFKAEGNVLHLYDIVSAREVDIHWIIRNLATKNINKIIFYFTPVNTDLHIVKRSYITDDYTFYVKSVDESLSGEFFYPYTAQA